MRHLPFRIDAAARDAWLTHMRAAVDAVAPPEPARSVMLGYFQQVADFPVNTGTLPSARCVNFR